MDRIIANSHRRVTCGFGEYAGHKGLDLGWSLNEEENKVYANCKGTVVAVQDGLDKMPISAGSWGNYVTVKHDNGMHSRYCHLRKGTVQVKIGQTVDENTYLGLMGDSGSTQGRHLHFEVQLNDDRSSRINPVEYLTKPICEENTQTNIDSTEITYIVVSGDTLSDIASKYNTTYQKLAEYNNIENPDLIYPGQQIKIPKDGENIYVVQSGDNLSSIASKFGTTWQAIYEKNKDIIGNNPDLIYEDQKLVIK